MVFIICVLVTILFTILCKVFDNKDKEGLSLLSAIVAFASGAAAVIMAIVLFITYIECPGTEAKLQERYVALNTRIENHMYYPWDRQQLIEDVQKWNENLVAQQAAQKNIWVAFFHPESIEGLDKINLERIDCGKTN